MFEAYLSGCCQKTTPNGLFSCYTTENRRSNGDIGPAFDYYMVFLRGLNASRTIFVQHPDRHDFTKT